MRRLVALIGRNKSGPWIDTRNFKEPELSVSGLQSDGQLLVSFGEDRVLIVTKNGRHPLQVKSDKLQICSCGQSPNLLCLVVSK